MVNSVGHRSAARVDKLIRDFDNFRAVNLISFEVHQSEIFGFAGPGGAGFLCNRGHLCASCILTAASALAHGSG